MRVIKFGGSSVGSAKALNCVASIVQGKLSTVPKLVVVVSALSGVTDSLLALCTEAARGGDGWRERHNDICAKHRDIIKELDLSSHPATGIVDGLLIELEKIT